MFTNLLQSLKTRLFGSSRARRRAYAKQSVTPACERLERREMLAATALLSNGTLSITGTDGNDNIKVKEVNGFAGSYLVVDGYEIAAGGAKIQGSYSLSSVKRIEINGLRGNDTITLNTSANAAVDLSATIYGGDGNDTIDGGNGNDRIYGGNGNDRIHGNAGNDSVFGQAGEDWLYGDSGDDYVDGGAAGVDGATVSERDYLEGGEGWDKFSDGFDFNKWIYNGATVTDIQQRETPTCQTLATLASAVDVGISFGDPKITAMGNNNYRIKLYNDGKVEYETVNFNGTWSDNDPAPSCDSQGKTNPEFWTILMQRARLEHFYGVDWSRKMTMADWDAVNRKTHTLYDAGTAIEQLHGWNSSYTKMNSMSASSLANHVNQGHIVVAASGNFSGINKSTGIAGTHAYAVTSVTKDSKGKYSVTLYNPWGYSQTLSWDAFKSVFQGVYTATR